MKRPPVDSIEYQTIKEVWNIAIVQKNQSDASRFFMIIAAVLYLEFNFKEQFVAAGKELLPYVREELGKMYTAHGLFNIMYDRHHKVRFAIETFDSIEECRQITNWLNENNFMLYAITDYNIAAGKVYFKTKFKGL